MGAYEDAVAKLVARLPCQDNANNTAITASIGGNGTLFGGSTASASEVAGPTTWLPNAITLDGDNDFIRAAFSRNSFSGHFAVGGWFRSAILQTPADQELLFGGADEVIGFAWSGGGSAAYQGRAYTSSGGFTAAGGPDTHGSGWNHLAWWWDGSRVRTVRNGQVLGNGPSRTSIVGSSDVIEFGRGDAKNTRATACEVADLFGMDNATLDDLAALFAGPQTATRRPASAPSSRSPFAAPVRPHAVPARPFA